MAKNNYRVVHAPDWADYKYIILDGEIFINADAKNPRMLAMFFRTGKESEKTPNKRRMTK